MPSEMVLTKNPQIEDRDDFTGTENFRTVEMGWTQEQIAEKVGLIQNRISQIINNTNFGKIDNDWKNGKSISDIAFLSYLNLIFAHFYLFG